ncbi:MAG TPA: DUF3662 and FHA domain-containing protein [Thermoleophilia bacterium]|nr:DUF3662 and FHA domain-containing protein [Thermoleophilia bacterium]
MGIFRKAEKKLEGAVEGGFGRAFKSSVQPVELAHKLTKEMGDHKTVGVSNVYVPNEFEVYLGSADFEHMTSLGDSLKAELSNYMVAFARREGWTLVAPPRIDLQRDDDLRVGEFGIATSHVEAPLEAPGAGFAAADAFAAADVPPPAGALPLAAAAPPLVTPVEPLPPRPQPEQTVLYQEAAAAPAAAPRRGTSRAALRGPQGEWELREEVTVLGRSRRCGIVLTDPNVSREHAEVRRQGDGFMLRDLGSTNGTRLNRRDVKQAVLQHGDRIELGTTELVFERLP